MTVFDLLFLGLLATAVSAVVAVARLAFVGQRARAVKLLSWLAAGVAAYLAVVALVGIGTPQKHVARGEPQCSDDWCIAVVDVQSVANETGVHYDVTFELSSRARSAPQRERMVVAYLRDAAGRRYDANPDTAAVPFDVLLAPSQRVRTQRAFVVPAGVVIVGLVFTHEGAGAWFPACCIIGDDGSLLHKRTLVRLE
jgi:hypothetical protein